MDCKMEAKALKELKFPAEADDDVPGLREFIFVILAMKRNKLSPAALIACLTPPPPPPPLLPTGDAPAALALTPLQMQIIQPFIRHIYGTDAFFHRHHSVPNRQRSPLRSRVCIFTAAQTRRYIAMHALVRRDAASAELCRACCFDRVRDGRVVSDDCAFQVASRLSIPRPWEDVVAYVVLSLRHAGSPPV